MRHTRILTVLALLCACSAGGAPAADWSGFYVGINRASTSLDTNWSTTEIRDPISGDEIEAASNTEESLESDESVTGLRIGYNWSFNRWFAGLEAVAGATEHTSFISHIPGLDFSDDESFVELRAETEDVNLRLRGGYLAMPELLLFVTAGNTKLDVGVTTTCPSDFSVCNPLDEPRSFDNSKNLNGVVIGFGAEYEIDHFLVHLEIVNADFDDFSFTAIPFEPIGSFGADATISSQVKTLQVGASYGF